MNLQFKFWENPALNSLNRLESRSTFYPFDTIKKAIKGQREDSPYYSSLNGTWKFKFFDSPNDVPESVFKKSVADQKWDKVPVPSCWQMLGYGHNHYTNHNMPFFNNPPHVPELNPTGVYRREFKIPKLWADRRIVLHFGSADSVLLVYVNGKFVGLSKDSRLPAEFDITQYVKVGSNTLAAEVVQWSDATYLEDQDQWWMSGLPREVFLFSTPKVYLKDFFAEGHLQENLQTGDFSFSCDVEYPLYKNESYFVQVQLYDEKGNAQFKKPLAKELPKLKNIYGNKNYVPLLKLSGQIQKPKLWSSETPYRYTTVVSLLDAKGKLIDCSSCTTGFRNVEVRDRKLFINGQVPLIRGVNRHEHDHVKGKALTREFMEQEVLVMKQNNFNAVRMSHYPNDPYFYDLCDRYGLYVIDETNLETHGNYNTICNDSVWASAFLERGIRMVQRDKNHPCIIAWSLGNESGYGANHDAMAAWMRSIDPRRPLHYEGAVREAGWDKAQIASDIICPMYSSVAKITDWVKQNRDDRPIILCEYTHAMGNSNGGLKEYWDAFRKYDGLQGGFIWEWKDHGILTKNSSGKNYWAYGGDFGDKPNDANFCLDGILWPDLKPHPAIAEIKKCQQAIHFRKGSRDGEYIVSNEFSFTNLNEFDIQWAFTNGYRIIKKGSIKISVLPHSEKRITIKAPKLTLNPSEEIFIQWQVSLKKNTIWAKAGFPIAAEQILVMHKPKVNAVKKEVSLIVPEVLHLAGKIAIKSSNFLYSFNTNTGQLMQIEKGGLEFLSEAAFGLHVTRAPTDNDGIKMINTNERAPLKRWQNMGLFELKTSGVKVKATRLKNAIQVDVQKTIHTSVFENAFKVYEKYVITSTGTMHVIIDVKLNKAIYDLPRIGYWLQLKNQFQNMQWYGRGPDESYSDRKYGYDVGYYQSLVKDQYVPYGMPQEHGNHHQTRWLTLADTKNNGLYFEGLSSLDTSASHFRTGDLLRASHPTDLTPRKEVNVYLDYKQRGLGTASCGPDALPPYLLNERSYHFEFKVIPMSCTLANCQQQYGQKF